MPVDFIFTAQLHSLTAYKQFIYFVHITDDRSVTVAVMPWVLSL